MKLFSNDRRHKTIFRLFSIQITIVETIPTKIHYIVHRELVRKTVSDVQIIDAFQPLGIVMAMTIVVMVLMNRQNTVNQKEGHVSAIYLRVTMEIAFREFIFVSQ